MGGDMFIGILEMARLVLYGVENTNFVTRRPQGHFLAASALEHLCRCKFLAPAYACHTLAVCFLCAALFVELAIRASLFAVADPRVRAPLAASIYILQQRESPREKHL